MLVKVVDASVLGSVVFREPRAEEANSLLRGAELHAPILMAYELTHVAQKKAHQVPAQRQAFEDALEAALSMNIRWRAVSHVKVLQIALDTGLTTYDASYLYVAQNLGASLVTFDEQLSSVWQSYAR